MANEESDLTLKEELDIMKRFINKHKESKGFEAEFKVALICGLHLNINLPNRSVVKILPKKKY
ncbi:hypothetical protein LCGC14_1038530 [marine sediment metagenome]|uniref:Uncharacterized protein n=1 Tax=marine sediment metagenome TaxID=412755 RepID=A0A0F9MWZ6_9ZZZZ